MTHDAVVAMAIQVTGGEFEVIPYIAGVLSTLLGTAAAVYLNYRSQKESFENQMTSERDTRAKDIRKALRTEIDIGLPSNFEIDEDDGTSREVTFEEIETELEQLGVEESLSILQFTRVPTGLYEVYKDDLGVLEDEEQRVIIEYYTRAIEYANQLEPLSLDHYEQLLRVIKEIPSEDSPDFLPTLETQMTEYIHSAYRQLLSVHASGIKALDVLNGSSTEAEGAGNGAEDAGDEAGIEEADT